MTTTNDYSGVPPLPTHGVSRETYTTHSQGLMHFADAEILQTRTASLRVPTAVC